MTGRGNLRGRLERAEASVEGMRPERNSGGAWERAGENLDALRRLILEHGDEIDRDYKERMGRGGAPKAALIAAKREALQKSAEGRRVWSAVEAIMARGGRGTSYGAL